jgi:polar amino acid transport system ATP-binding protein
VSSISADEDFFGKPIGRNAPGAIMVDLQSVYLSFGKRVALDGMTLPVKAREVTGLIGPAGSGKTTVLRAIAHLDRIDAGRIYVDGGLLGYVEDHGTLRELPPKRTAHQRRDVALVSATFDLFPHLSAIENVIEAPVRVRGQKRKAATDTARVLLDQLGVAGAADTYPVYLSPDQRQRVAIARALAMQPKLLMLDDPTSVLGEASRREVTDVIRTLAANGLTTIVTTHDLAFARDVTQHLVVLDRGDVAESGDPRGVLGNPQDERTKAYLSTAP